MESNETCQMQDTLLTLARAFKDERGYAMMFAGFYKNTMILSWRFS